MTTKTRASNLLDRAQSLREWAAKARVLGPELKGRLAEIDANENWTDDYKAAERERLRSEYAASLAEVRSLVVDTRTDLLADLQAERTATQPDGVEGIAARMEAADARQRVRSLLAAGRDPRDIISTARQHGDRLTLEAVREEGRWIEGAGEGLDGVVRRALAAVAPEGERELYEVETIVLDDWPLIDHQLTIADKLDSGPSMEDAVTAKVLEARRAELEIDHVRLPADVGDSPLEHAVHEEFATMAADSVATDTTEVTA